MKAIVTVNCDIPTVEDQLGYFSGESLSDYDIAVFSPNIPFRSRIQFDGGGSCLTVESTVAVRDAMSHWASEFQAALKVGKTIFIILDEYEDDSGTTGSTLVKNHRTFSTFRINNYDCLPAKLTVKNAKGRKVIVTDRNYSGLYDAVKDITQYRVVLTSGVKQPIYTTKDGATLGGVLKSPDYSGTVVLLPYFDFNDDNYTEEGENGPEWSSEALSLSKRFVSQLIAIDKFVKGSIEATPPPDWMQEIEGPGVLATIDESVRDLESQIAFLQQQRGVRLSAKAEVLEYSHLLYENGKTLERAVEKALRLLGYTAETFRTGALEIDHVIVGSSGKRMIGESEGKDNSPIDITKFRQLESNIGEDFERDDVKEPAKGLLFGNGFRLLKPDERPEQFTQKSLTNAKRLGSALIRTVDLYPVVTYLLDHPDDDSFKAACRAAIEETDGGIVEFPSPT